MSDPMQPWSESEGPTTAQLRKRALAQEQIVSTQAIAEGNGRMESRLSRDEPLEDDVFTLAPETILRYCEASECERSHGDPSLFFADTKKRDGSIGSAQLVEWPPNGTGNLVLIGAIDGAPLMRIAFPEEIGVAKLYMPHFATCPAAKQFRRS